MERQAVIEKLTRNAAKIRSLGVGRLYLFGSTVAGGARAGSDVDMFIDYDDPNFSLVELVRLKRMLSELLGTEADVTTRESLHPSLREKIQSSAERVI